MASYVKWVWLVIIQLLIILGNSLSSLPRHLATPTTSESRANVATDASAATSNFPRTQLLKAHGRISQNQYC